MKIKSNFLLSDIEGENVVITVGDVENSFNGYLKLNKTAAFLWKELESGASKDELITSLQTTYNIEKQIAEEDLDDFLKIMEQIDALDF